VEDVAKRRKVQTQTQSPISHAGGPSPIPSQNVPAMASTLTPLDKPQRNCGNVTAQRVPC
jgi:hypothetical protein